jgi:cytochrome b subunit of formate dehydrogenase
MLETLTTLLLPWSELYAESAWIPTTVLAVHVLALFAGGGIAIAADRRVLRATPGTREAYQAAAEDLRTTHAIVIGSIVIMIVSGVALATSDIGTFAVSTVFWAKMAAFTVLIANGAYMRRTESRVLNSATDARVVIDKTTQWPSDHLPWAVLKRSATVSLIAWFTVVLLGVVLSDI